MSQGMKIQRGGAGGSFDVETAEVFSIIRESSGGTAKSVEGYKFVMFGKSYVAYLVDERTAFYAPGTTSGAKIQKLTETTTVGNIIIDPVAQTVHTTSSEHLYCWRFK